MPASVTRPTLPRRRKARGPGQRLQGGLQLGVQRHRLAPLSLDELGQEDDPVAAQAQIWRLVGWLPLQRAGLDQAQARQPAAKFVTFTFRGQLAGPGGSLQALDIRVTDQHGAVTDLGLVSAQANGRFGPFGVLGLAGETVASVELTAANGIKEVKQIELGRQGQAGPSVVSAPLRRRWC
jgi:hypothetical protein